MTIETILRPDNRLLGWSTGDFSLYGGQPDPAVTIGRPASVAAVDMPSLETEAVPIDFASDVFPNSLPVSVDDEAASPDGGVLAHSAIVGAAPPISQAAFSGANEDGQPTALAQGGSTAPYLIAQPTFFDHSHQGDDGIQPAAASGLTASPFTTEGFVTSAIGTISAQPASSFTTIQTGDAVAAVANDALGAVHDVQSGLIETLAQTTAALDHVGAGVTAVSDAIGGVAADATQAVNGLVQSPVHDIDQIVFQGSDPAGGIATLVDMVHSSELFSVGQADASPAAPDATGSIVDDLVGDASLAAPLLGDDAHDSHHLADLGDLHTGL